MKKLFCSVEAVNCAVFVFTTSQHVNRVHDLGQLIITSRELDI